MTHNSRSRVLRGSDAPGSAPGPHTLPPAAPATAPAPPRSPARRSAPCRLARRARLRPANPPQPRHARQGSDVTTAVRSRGARACLPGVWLSASPALRGCASCSAGLQALHCCRCLAGLDLALSAHARSRCLLPVHLYRDVARQLRSARPSYTESLRRFRSACLLLQLLTLPGILAVSATQLLQLGPFPCSIPVLLAQSHRACGCADSPAKDFPRSLCR